MLPFKVSIVILITLYQIISPYSTIEVIYQGFFQEKWVLFGMNIQSVDISKRV